MTQQRAPNHSISAATIAKTLAEGLADASAIFDSELNLIHYNGLYAQLTGLRRAALEKALHSGTNPFSLIGRNEEQDTQVALKCLKDRQPVRLAEVVVKDAQQNQHTVDMTFIPIGDFTSDEACLLQIIRDVSDESRMQTHYKDLLRLTEARAEDLERIVEQRTQELSAALESVTRLSRTDPLTDLLNRRAFVDHAEHALRLAERHGRIVAVLMCDLDFFKKVNDVYGHQAGDAILVETGLALSNCVRKSDVVARIGGEEFVIMLTETDEDYILEVCRRCMTAIRGLDLARILGDGTKTQTISIGAAIFPRHGNALTEIMSSADQALYMAKRTGRDRVVMYSESLIKGVGQRQAMSRVLIADPDMNRRQLYSKVLSHSYELHFASTTAEALSICRRTRFEAILADEQLDEDRAVGFLSQALHMMPEAVRILCLVRGDFVLAAKGANMAGVDSFILRSDIEMYLSAAIEDGAIRRRLVGQRLLDGVDMARNAYTFRADQLENMIRTKSLHIAVQPIVQATNLKIFGYEVLSRPPAESKLGPKELFDTALEVGRLWTLSRMVRERVAEKAIGLPPDALIFVNLHPGELDDPQLQQGDPFLRALAGRVVFEITERTPINDYPSFREKVARLRSNGYRIAVDDLGAGYASLNSLAMLEPDFVKIDQELVRECHASQRRLQVIERIIGFARDQDAKIIAEGIETQQEADQMKRLGCDFLQGFLFGVPVAIPAQNIQFDPGES